MQGQRKTLVTSALVAAGLLLIFLGSLFWSYRHHASIAASSKAVLKAPPTAAIGTPDNEVTSDATAAIDPDPFAGFQQLKALPQDAARPKPRIDPVSLRTMVDRGVVAYASAKTDAERAKGASQIQVAALAGFPAARVLLARNYPQSEAIRSVVPANDVIGFALALLMGPTSEGDDTKQIFLALGQHLALHGQLDLLATQILNSLRADSRPQLSRRIDILLDLLSRVPGSCAALGRLIDASDQECSASFSEQLRRHIYTNAGR